MENNKLLIGIQFTQKNKGKQTRTDNITFNHTTIELFVVRDITLLQLIEGIKYGLIKLINSNSKHTERYQHCYDIFSSCVSEDSNGMLSIDYNTITLTSFNASLLKNYNHHEKLKFSKEDLSKPICDLGFITSTRIIFDESAEFPPKGQLDTSHIIKAFDPSTSEKLFFPEYNISSRQLYRFDSTPVNIIPPTEPPKKPQHGLMYMLLPSIVSMGIPLIIRMALTDNSGSGISMAVMSLAMGAAALVTSIIAWNRQKKEYNKNLQDWREQYQNYINSVIKSIKERQARDVQKLNELYPDILSLIETDSQGVYSFNDNIFCRSPQDEDFLTFRIGTSNNVRSMFEIQGENKDIIFSESFFEIQDPAQNNNYLKIHLRDELSSNKLNKENLCKLPSVISQKYSLLNNAPLLYSLKNKGALGIVDSNIDGDITYSSYFISRMIFELCYYHSPEDLQFVIFFPKEDKWDTIENTINKYKFMPHFHGLFHDKSQFVFDKDGANAVLGNLLTLINERNTENEEHVSKPHIVFIVFDEHDLKEHAFAEHLPQPPESDQPFVNTMGLTFVFATKYKEYLPAYCDDIIRFDHQSKTLTPRDNIANRKLFFYNNWDNSLDKKAFFIDYTQKITRALRFFSSIYYAHIAQNGKVPSSVSLFEMLDGTNDLCKTIRTNWGLNGERPFKSITESLNVAIGKTEKGLAYLDLHEKADGPHMLVAGTTGSGKTETIISFLLQLCMQYRPDEINLLLVDMKGGGFTKRLGNLPHVVGSITDVDGDENGTGAEYMLNRFLNATKAEIKRRKILFNKLHVDSIDSYIQACNDIEAHIKSKGITDALEIKEITDTANTLPLSHLILVVDEFTELKRFTSENSDIDFISEITTIARIGRSLGLHIILISQNIEGAITDDIRVNSKARLCLKVATRQASKEMIGTDLAASPYMPGFGRAYLLVGTGSRLEYFQSAYCGAGVEEKIPVDITLASKTGNYLCFYQSDKDNLMYKNKIKELKKAGKSKTQLEVINQAIISTYNSSNPNTYKIHQVFSQPLSKKIAWDSATGKIIDLNKRKQVN